MSRAARALLVQTTCRVTRHRTDLMIFVFFLKVFFNGSSSSRSSGTSHHEELIKKPRRTHKKPCSNKRTQAKNNPSIISKSLAASMQWGRVVAEWKPLSLYLPSNQTALKFDNLIRLPRACKFHPEEFRSQLLLPHGPSPAWVRFQILAGT